jgi:hypothetical protein
MLEERASEGCASWHGLAELTQIRLSSLVPAWILLILGLLVVEH